MSQTMVHRGPYAAGIWLAPDGPVALAPPPPPWLDASAAGHQPMYGMDQRTIIVFNGELYNFRELREELEHDCVQFATHSDTEVLLAHLRRAGTDALVRFDAMFAFAYYDCDTRELLLARDIFGEKPLYYIDTPDYFAFASELHALTSLPFFNAGVSADAVASYLCFQYVPAPQTIYSSARKLLPAHWLRLGADGSATIKPYFSFVTSGEQESGRGIDDLADE